MGIIRDLAGKKYRLAYDESSQHEARHKEDGKILPDEMYEVIPCKYGAIYSFGDGKLAWHCPSRLKGTYAQRVASWIEVQVEADNEWIFLFPVERFESAARIAGARTRRQISSEQHQHLKDIGYQKGHDAR